MRRLFHICGPWKQKATWPVRRGKSKRQETEDLRVFLGAWKPMRLLYDFINIWKDSILKDAGSQHRVMNIWVMFSFYMYFFFFFFLLLKIPGSSFKCLFWGRPVIKGFAELGAHHQWYLACWCLITLTRWSIYKKTRIGPRMLPWETPSFVCNVLWYRSNNKRSCEWNQSSATAERPTDFFGL